MVIIMLCIVRLKSSGKIVNRSLYINELQHHQSINQGLENGQDLKLKLYMIADKLLDNLITF